MTLGRGEKVMIAYYVNPHEFYIQLLTDDEDFKKMMEDIQCFYSDKYSIKYDLEVLQKLFSYFVFLVLSVTSLIGFGFPCRKVMYSLFSSPTIKYFTGLR